MYDCNELKLIIADYLKRCNYHPTCRGLAYSLNISTSTIYRVISGFYNHKPYGEIPCSTRCINTKDFWIIRGVFAKRCEVTQH